jgi:hypothetical protein
MLEKPRQGKAETRHLDGEKKSELDASSIAVKA